jgi:hypothetical protein
VICLYPRAKDIRFGSYSTNVRVSNNLLNLARRSVIKPSTCEEFFYSVINSSHIEGFLTKSCSEITVISLQDLALKPSTCEEF